MLGPFNLQYIHVFVAKLSPGAFILSRNGSTAEYVGMSDEDIGQALSSFRSTTEYRYFWYCYTDTAHEARELAQAWYHRYLPSDNILLPKGLNGSAWHCTVSGCTACALALIRSSVL